MDRKQLINELQLKFETKAKYLRVPSCAYEIKILDKTYIINKEGKIMNSEGVEILLDDLLNISTASEAESDLNEETYENIEITNEIEELEELNSATTHFELKLPLEGHSANTLKNLINMIYAKQPLILKALEINEELLTENFVSSLNKITAESLEDFKSAIAKIEEYKHQKIEFDFDEETFMFRFESRPEKLNSTMSLIALVNKTSLIQKHASYKTSQTKNEKYTFRTWLLRLGMIGEEYKDVRKELLSTLSGNAAFRIPNKAGDSDETQM